MSSSFEGTNVNISNSTLLPPDFNFGYSEFITTNDIEYQDNNQEFEDDLFLLPMNYVEFEQSLPTERFDALEDKKFFTSEAELMSSILD